MRKEIEKPGCPRLRDVIPIFGLVVEDVLRRRLGVVPLVMVVEDAGNTRESKLEEYISLIEVLDGILLRTTSALKLFGRRSNIFARSGPGAPGGKTQHAFISSISSEG